MSESTVLVLPAPARKLSPGWIVALIGIPIFIGALDLTVVSAVLPHVLYDLQIPIQTQLDQAAWMVTGYLLAYSIAMGVMGHFSDLWGRRKIFLIALAIFTLGSLLVAISDGWLTQAALKIHYLFSHDRVEVSSVSLDLIIASRMIQALGGGAMVPVGMALVGDLYPSGKRSRALGIIAAIDTAGWVVGHLYGGIIVYYFNWHVIFWLNLPICLIAFMIIFWALRGLPQEKNASHMDWLGVLGVAAFLSLLIIGIGGGGEANISIGQGAQDKSILWQALVGSAVCLAALLWWENQSHTPMFDPALFKIRNVVYAGAANFLIGCSLFIAIANVPLFISSLVAGTLEQGAWQSGWVLSALTIPAALAALPGGWLTEKWGYRVTSLVGLAIAVAGFAWMFHWGVGTSIASMVPQLILTGIGFGLTFSPIASAALDAAPPSQHGSASAWVLTLRLIGMTVGVSSMTTYDINRANYLTGSLIPADASLNQMYEMSQQILVRVIDETFLIAAALCVLAAVFTLFLVDFKGSSGEKNHEL
jgi:MFS family permease